MRKARVMRLVYPNLGKVSQFFPIKSFHISI